MSPGQSGHVSSRSARGATIQRFDLEPAACHGSYEALLADEQVEAVYLSLPNHLHHAWTLKALEAGKHVLCEKPIAMNAGEAEAMFDTADQHGLTLMEAFMYRTHPLTLAVQQAVADQAIGQLKIIRASFCYRTNKTDGNVRFDPAIGGGALMDIGCYCLSFARLFAGAEPTDARIVGHLHDTGVDDYACVTLKFPNDITAALTFGMTVQLDNTAYLGGTDGYIEIPVPWKPPVKNAQYILAGQRPPKMDHDGKTVQAPPRETVTVDAPAPLYGMEADVFAAVVAGETPLPVTRQDSVGNMQLLDRLREQLGLAW